MPSGTRTIQSILVFLALSAAVCSCSSSSSPDPTGGSGTGGYGILAPIPIVDSGPLKEASAEDGGSADGGTGKDALSD
jgi:hypothetical protein